MQVIAGRPTRLLPRLGDKSVNRDLKHRRRNGTTTPTGSEIFPREPSGHASGCQNVVQPSSTTESEQVFALVKT